MKHLFILEGREVEAAVQSVTLTRCVNDDRDLRCGSACAAVVEAVFLDRGGDFLPRGEMELYAVEGEERRLLGLFTPENLRKGGSILRMTAYDRMLRFDRDLTGWLTALEGWPYRVEELLTLVCRECGVELAEQQLPQGEKRVMRFLRNVTGRQLVRWIAELCGGYACITPQGKLAVESYGEGGSVALPQKQLKLESVTTAPIRRICIRQNAEDLGISWPEQEGEAYTLTDNPLLAAFHQEEVLEIAKFLWEKLGGISYTPLKAELFGGSDLEPGRFYTFTDRLGNAYRAPVFTATYRRGMTVLECTGAPSRSGATALATQDQVKVIQGRVAQLRADMDGISTSLRETVLDLEGVKTREAAIDLTLGSISSQVASTQNTTQGLQEQLTRVEQNATALEVTVGSKADREEVQELSRHFVFDGEGLTIRSGSGMGLQLSEEQILFTGGSSATTQIQPHQMQSTNLRIGSRLDLGRFTFFPRTNGNLSLRYTAITGE